MSNYSSRMLFQEINGTDFKTYKDLQEAILAKFNEHLADFPPRYSYLQLIDWGTQNGWIASNGSGYVIRYADTGVGSR